MARNLEDIQREIERTRRQLASTLDEIADRSKPANLVEDAKVQASAKLQDPQAQKILAGVAAAVVGVIVVGVLRSRKRRTELEEIKRLLAAR
ncbi:DUF3618 domain-containing protein [Corynebacterium sp. 153RC1]|uniref:DUF3618 domain-containing protein n=1 Tax=unclassified Corynebacterium TaxID=2624378 RepID=UPI00211D0256|nr:DUF3618 domain-containing protein [Corynebacterium sp. 209RC1]MCQ9355516.1 DUF3618 domain-containing protein [Corynebacterium sp. 1222RC1]MCQ9357687.1 DUF3618 domain-containing protein [Corynebacterium sp. 122RC1]MCQ9359894.1 DUF3618 domain-containing protein [Corynebacterium sp. 142RC1]MCQ9362023.1 DUF3618 domain-containing protein [Corynebacterium sp. 153RC1]MCQ9364078.1 DUF3618 domain-containing protein [Corynebacterium sp. 732RC1]MCQ9366227.1 DUF3618 domain-containing protein [Coryneba